MGKNSVERKHITGATTPVKTKIGGRPGFAA